jgi:stress-induced morphogen
MVSRSAVADPCLEEVIQALEKYKADHPQARVDAYRYNPASIRIRVIDPDFGGKSLADRDEAVWKFLEELPEGVMGHVSLVLPLTPSETNESLANLDFEKTLAARISSI